MKMHDTNHLTVIATIIPALAVARVAVVVREAILALLTTTSRSSTPGTQSTRCYSVKGMLLLSRLEENNRNGYKVDD